MFQKMGQAIRDKISADGYVVIENFLQSTECDELVSAGLKFTTDLPEPSSRTVFSSINPDLHVRQRYFIESNDKIMPFFEEGALDDSGELKVPPNVSLNKVGHALHLRHPIFRCYTYCDRMKSLCAELNLKQPAVIQSMLIYKNPGVGGEVIAHQDATYLHTEPVPVYGFWIALADATVENGCLWIAEGSHKSGVHRRMMRNPDPESKTLMIFDKAQATYPESNFIPVPVKKGTCIILHGHVIHKSAGNKSNKPRPAYTFHVIEKMNNTYSPENWLQEGPEAPFLDFYDTLQIERAPTPN